MLSMTGYGRGTAPLGSSQLVVDVRAVNHRFLELRLHVGPELAGQAAAIEECVRARAGRGRIDVSARIEGALPGQVALDLARARAAFTALEQLRDELSPAEPLPLALLAGVPGLFREVGGPDERERSAAGVSAASIACDQLIAMRRAEGTRLSVDLRARCEAINTRLEALTPTLPSMLAEQQRKLRARLAQLIEPTGFALDAARLEHELALLAERADISEELTRLAAHAAALLPLLATTADEPVGHPLDFLLQEMSREANTAAAKLPDAAATQVMLAIKAELLRMREQVQNVL
jgi:uncharacterized protein (TIGR00255 family)